MVQKRMSRRASAAATSTDELRSAGLGMRAGCDHCGKDVPPQGVAFVCSLNARSVSHARRALTSLAQIVVVSWREGHGGWRLLAAHCASDIGCRAWPVEPSRMTPPAHAEDHHSVGVRIGDLSTAHVTDACRRLSVGPRAAPPLITALGPGQRLSGRVLPVRYFGSMDVFLEAIDGAEPDDVLVIDNKGRMYESCISELAALELPSAGVAGAMVWEAHRDTGELLRTDFTVFSCGSFPCGPQQSRQRHEGALLSARVGHAVVTRHMVFLVLGRLSSPPRHETRINGELP